MGQQAVQIKPNLVWSIFRVGRLWDKKNGPPNFHWNKVRISIGNIDFFDSPIFKNIVFLSGQGVVQSEPHLLWIITSVMKLWSKKNFLYSLPWKKISFSCGNLQFFQISNFKNRSFLSGQEIVQIKPNLVWSIPRVGKLWDKKNGPPNFSSKVRISIRNINFFDFSIFKNIEFLSGQGVVQSEPHLVWIITSVMQV